MKVPAILLLGALLAFNLACTTQAQRDDSMSITVLERRVRDLERDLKQMRMGYVVLFTYLGPDLEKKLPELT